MEALTSQHQADSSPESHGEDANVSATEPHAAISTSGTQALQPHANNHVTDAPPFWSRHGRSVSTVSYHSIVQTRRAPILLEDHSEENHEQSLSCWAQSVSVDDYVIVSGPTGIGAYVVWHCTVSTIKGGDMSLRKRFVSRFSRAARKHHNCQS